MDDLFDPSLVLLFRNAADTTAAAAPEMEIQAGAEFLAEDRLRSDFEVAVAQGVHLGEESDQVPGVQDGTVRAEIAVPAALVHPPGNEHLRKLVPGHADPGIGLRILQEDIVLGLVLLDEIVLEEQRVSFGIDDGILGVRDPGDQQAGLGVQPLGRHKILGDPFVEILRLPHINDVPRGVVIPIDSRGMRKKCDFLFYGHYFRQSATALRIASPRRSRLRIVPSGPKRMIWGMPSMP